MTLSEQDVTEILRIIDETPLAEIHVETDGFVLHVITERGRSEAAQARREPTRASAASIPANNETVTIKAPMLGVFYAADAPGEPPFVEQGTRVEPDTTLCIIEVMKMMNSVSAGVSGTVVEICQENGDVVEEGATLFRIATAA